MFTFIYIYVYNSLMLNSKEINMTNIDNLNKSIVNLAANVNEDGYSKLFANTYGKFLVCFAEANGLELKDILKANEEDEKFRKGLGEIFLGTIEVALKSPKVA
jgi:hypothetical protein